MTADDLPEGTTIWEGCDNALIGIGHRCGQPPLAVYDFDALIQGFMDRNQWDREEATEWVVYNIAEAWIGDGTPVILIRDQQPKH